MKPNYLNRQVETILLETGITIAHSASTSVNDRRHGVEMCLTPIGVQVLHIKSKEEHLVPYSNILTCKLLHEQSAS